MAQKMQDDGNWIDRPGLCDWLITRLAPQDSIVPGGRRALCFAVALATAPHRFTKHHFVNLVFRSCHDQSDVGGKCYDDHICLFRVMRDKVSVRWACHSCDDYVNQSEHHKGRLVYDGFSTTRFVDFIEKIEYKLIIGDLVGYSYNTGVRDMSDDYSELVGRIRE